MWRILVPVLMGAIVAVPAAAVVVIHPAAATTVPQQLPPAEPPPAPGAGFSFGETAAAITGLVIFGIAFGSRRRSVTA